MKPLRNPYSVAYAGRLITSHASLPAAVDEACIWATTRGEWVQDMTITHIPTAIHWTLAQAANLCRQPVLPDPNALSRWQLEDLPTTYWFSVACIPHRLHPDRWAAHICYHFDKPISTLRLGGILLEPKHWIWFTPATTLSTGDWGEDFAGYEAFQGYAYPLNRNHERVPDSPGLTINHLGQIEPVPWRGATG